MTADGAAGKTPAQVLLDHFRETMTLPEALDRVQRNIEVGRQGWADPELLAALEKVYAAAAAHTQADSIRREFLDELIFTGANLTALSYDEIVDAIQRVEKRWKEENGRIEAR